MPNGCRKIRHGPRPRMFNGKRVKTAAEYNAEWGPTSTNNKRQQEELQRKEKEEEESKKYRILIPYENCQKFVKICGKKVDNPENLQLNTLASDFPILKYHDIDFEKMVLVEMKVIDLDQNVGL